MQGTLAPVLTTDAVAEAAGVTYRQLDWWVRSGVIAPVRPANGSGTRRAWSPDQIRLVRAIAFLRSCGASIDDAGRCAAELALLPVEHWTGFHIFDGRYVVDLRAMIA